MGTPSIASTRAPGAMDAWAERRTIQPPLDGTTSSPVGAPWASHNQRSSKAVWPLPKAETKRSVARSNGDGRHPPSPRRDRRRRPPPDRSPAAPRSGQSAARPPTGCARRQGRGARAAGREVRSGQELQGLRPARNPSAGRSLPSAPAVPREPARRPSRPEHGPRAVSRGGWFSILPPSGRRTRP